ncbi:MAG: hypothetical protein HYR90_01740 [Candidatus Andersenbacteria bacterium]|nr:hypothetical protein [Candidatus Andersenbacteria bacterium]MBI3250882.1 hypothetical protein [Candidatus Andersenbacteria bacterium]
MKRSNPLKKILIAGFIVVITSVPQISQAHRSGCHNLHTCPSDSNSYACGDLGYPCDGSTSIENIALSAINVPLLVEKTFMDIFGRKLTEPESTYWKKRFRADKESVHQVRRAMLWHKGNGSFGPPASTSKKNSFGQLVKNINVIFRSVYNREPTVSENQYWISRVSDKPSERALTDAMGFHKARSIQH